MDERNRHIILQHLRRNFIGAKCFPLLSMGHNLYNLQNRDIFIHARVHRSGPWRVTGHSISTDIYIFVSCIRVNTTGLARRELLVFALHGQNGGRVNRRFYPLF